MGKRVRALTSFSTITGTGMELLEKNIRRTREFRGKEGNMSWSNTQEIYEKIWNTTRSDKEGMMRYGENSPSGVQNTNEKHRGVSIRRWVWECSGTA